MRLRLASISTFRAQLVQLRVAVKHALEAHRVFWRPFPDRKDGSAHPQRLALESQADILGYGGQAGGGKSDLLLGAAQGHWRSAIYRREYPALEALIDRSRAIFNPDTTYTPATTLAVVRDAYNESLHRWRFLSGAMLRFFAIQHEKDVLTHQGQPRDYQGFDELTEFSEYIFRFVIGWNRTTREGQRCRVIGTMNPPTTKEGRWVVRYFAPWLDKRHPRPAKPGELRWFTTHAGRDVEVLDGRPFVFAEDGTPRYDYDAETTPEEDVIYPKSRTFVFASVRDNPILIKQGYVATLQALPEPLRSIMLLGDWEAGVQDDAWQLFPTAWVEAAQERWRTVGGRPPAGARMDQLGVDVSRGGKDRTVATPRYGTFFGAQQVHQGLITADGWKVATLILNAVGRWATIAIDVLAVGSSPYDILKQAHATVPVNFAAGSERRTRQGGLKFYNVRAEWYWVLREALDPEGGEEVAIPDDPELLVELTAVHWELTRQGVKIESKEEIYDRIKCSIDKADSLVYAARPVTVASFGDAMIVGGSAAAERGAEVGEVTGSPWSMQ